MGSGICCSLSFLLWRLWKCLVNACIWEPFLSEWFPMNICKYLGNKDVHTSVGPIVFQQPAFFTSVLCPGVWRNSFLLFSGRSPRSLFSSRLTKLGCVSKDADKLLLWPWDLEGSWTEEGGCCLAWPSGFIGNSTSKTLGIFFSWLKRHGEVVRALKSSVFSSKWHEI